MVSVIEIHQNDVHKNDRIFMTDDFMDETLMVTGTDTHDLHLRSTDV